MIRANCVDCLDRTNSFQQLVGEAVLIIQLNRLIGEDTRYGRLELDEKYSSNNVGYSRSILSYMRKWGIWSQSSTAAVWLISKRYRRPHKVDFSFLPPFKDTSITTSKMKIDRPRSTCSSVTNLNLKGRSYGRWSQWYSISRASMLTLSRKWRKASGFKRHTTTSQTTTTSLTSSASVGVNTRS